MAEFQLINKYFRNDDSAKGDASIRVPSGDDAAVLSVCNTAFNTNSCFIRFYDCDTETVVRNKCESAMENLLHTGPGAQHRPAWLVLNLVMSGDNPPFLPVLSATLQACLKKHTVFLIGGDTTRGANQAVLTLISRADPDQNDAG